MRPAQIAIALSFLAACASSPPATVVAPAPAPSPPTPHTTMPPPARASDAAPPSDRISTHPLPPPAFVDPKRDDKIKALIPKLEKRIDDFFAVEKPPSIAVAMVVDGKVVMSRVLGVRDRASGAKPTTHTLYRIGSITKTFTAAALLSLRDAGAVRLDVPAATYLPELASVEYPFADAPRITLRHLLTHSSGLPRMGDFDYRGDVVDVTEKQMLDALPKAQLMHAPGTTYSYSNFGMSLVGVAIARRAPEGSLRAAMQKRVTEPLGMTSTTFDPSTLESPELATGYAKKTDTTPEKPWHLGASEAAGGIWSSLDDMARWIAFNLSAWPARAERDTGPIVRATMREAHVPQFPLGLTARTEGTKLRARSGGIGMAWHTKETCAYEALVEHSGAIDGFHAAVGFAPERGYGFVVLANSVDTPTSDLRDALFEESASLPAREEVPAPETLVVLDRFASSFSACEGNGYDQLLTSSFRSMVPKTEFTKICKQLATRHGACKRGETLELESPRVGTFLLSCERGAIRTWASIDSEGEAARFGGLYVRSTGFAPKKEVLAAADAALKLFARWDAARFPTVFASADAAAAVKAGFDKQRAETGACRLAPNATASKDGDGESGALLTLACDRGTAPDVAIDIDDKGKVKSFFFKPHSGGGHAPRCVDPK